MKFPVTKISQSPDQTEQFAKEFASELKDGDIVALSGELGAGKTIFVKAACGYFDVINSSSPSFAIVNEYSGKKKIFHFDFYRINKIQELYDLGIEEYLGDESSIIFVEWSEKFRELIPRNHYYIKITVQSDTNRKIEIKYNE